MKKKLFNLIMALTLLLGLIPSVAVAALQGQGETVYTVQKDDSLWAIAEKYLGSGAAYGAIVVATNARHETDSSFAKIENPGVIQPGWKILVPSVEEAAKLLEKWVAEAPAVGGQLIVGMDFEPSGMDPHRDLHKYIPILLWPVYDTLIYKDAKGNFVPGLAKSWEVSEDGLTYTFKLRQGVKFHDGTPFNAEAVKFSFDRIVDPATKSRNAINLIGPYESTEIVDDYTVKVHLKGVYAPFLDAVSQAWLSIVSPTAVKQWGIEKYYAHQVGTGPFRSVEYVEKDHITLERNPDYNWAPPHVKHQGPAYLDGITFKFIPEDVTRLGTLETGETNLITKVPPFEVERLKADPKFQVIPVFPPGMPEIYLINTAKAPTDELAVRQALLYAVDRENLIKVLYGGVFGVAYGPMTSTTFGYDPGLKSMYPYNPDKAKALLEEAGWKVNPATGIREKDGQPLKLLLMDFGQRLAQNEFVQAELKKIGVAVELQTGSSLAYIQACGKGEAHLCPIALSASDPSFLNGFFMTGAKYDWTFYHPEGLDKLLDEGGKTLDPAKRASIYQQFQETLLKGAAILPVYEASITAIYGVRAEIKGLAFDGRSDPIFYDVYIQK